MDQISNFIIELKNAGNAGHEEVVVSYSKLKRSVAEVLKVEGFVKDVEEKTVKGKSSLIISLIMDNRVPKIKGVARISKPSKRIYKKASEMRAVKSGYGALIVSTSQGIMSGQKAKKAALGGEALFSIW